MIELKSVSRERLDEVAEELLSLWAQARSQAIFLLEGEMGAGKTELTKAIVENLSGSSEACSPSFAIHNEYLAGNFTVHHLDLFRLESEDDLETTGFWDVFDQPNSLVVIEWASKLKDFSLIERLPKHWRKISVLIGINPDGTRDFLID